MATSAGEALHQRLRDGDLSAAVPFAYQVFEKGYKGSSADEKAAGSKKAAKTLVRQEAMDYLINTADGGSLDAMLELTEFWFCGVREPGPFGSTLVIPAYRRCRPYLQQILEHADSDDSEKAQAAFRLAQTFKLVGDEVEAAESLWRRALELEPDGESGRLARAALGEWLNANKPACEEAKTLLTQAAETVASSAFALADGYRRGVWAAADPEQARTWFQRGHQLLSEKRRAG